MPEWLLGILDSGTLAAAAAAPLGEGGDRRGRRKESSDEEGWVCGAFTGWNCQLCMDLCSSCLAPAKGCHLISSPPTDTNLPVCPHVQASPMRPLSRGWLPCQFPVGMWVPALIRNKAPEKSKCYKKMQNPISKSLSHCSIKVLHVIPVICVYLMRVKCRLWKELEALQHQRSVGMHTYPPHATRKSTRAGEQGCLPLLTSFLIKIKEVYEIEFSGIALRSNGSRLLCI